MAETIGIDIIGTDGFENISGVTRFDDNKIFVSGNNKKKHHIYSLAEYKYCENIKFFDGPNYNKLFIKNNIRSLSTFQNLLLIILKDVVKIYFCDPIKNEKYEIKIWNQNNQTECELEDFIFNEIIMMDNTLNKNNVKLKHAIVINEKIYLFIESKRESKAHNNLFILEGTLNFLSKCTHNKFYLNNDFKIKTFYNLYKIGKNAGFKKCVALTTKFKSVAYDEKDTFVLLFYCKKSEPYSFLAKLKLFTEFNSLSANLEIIKKISNNRELYCPSKFSSAITFLGNNNFVIVTNKHNNEISKCVIVKISNC